ncbi:MULTISPECIES: hypothetical protein [unclassified Spirosoma]|uniref:hypothetical protein n=1 Tax=unclassified Spirosoma TaxID=2621999 RepID=UPI00095B4DC1|nr:MULTISPECIES: hypothetical protein [unclassified Spirosoma]MBN8822954.1 hypothetical protein [Spirosoma sp.]OJW80137.1 MAG: hypothetical protein BGO59_02745 [Spirosoma sp. 48-14]
MPIAKYISVIIASTIKFIGGPLTGVALGLSWLETAIFTTLGMMLSVVVVTYAGAALQALWQRYRSTPPKRFTRRTRLAIRIWKRAGMAGIALLTPLILTPIGGTILAVSFGVKRGQLLLYMLISGIIWAVVQTVAVYQIPGLKGIFG